MPVVRAEAIWRDYGWFLVTDPGAPTDPSDVDRVLRIAEATTVDLGGPGAGQWVATDKGWLGKLGAATDRDSAFAWLEAFAARWADEAIIEPRPRRRSPGRRDARPTLTLAMAYTSEDLTHLPREDRGLTWAVPVDVTRGLARNALEWLSLEGASTFYSLSTLPTLWSTPTLGLPHPESLTEAVMEPLARIELWSGRTSPVRHRSVEFEREGRVACQDVDQTLDTRDALAQLLACLRWQPSGLDYAFIGWAHGGLTNLWWGDHMHYDLPGGLSEPDVRGHRRLWSSYVPDAFGVQVLTEAHLDRAHDLGAWHINELAPGRYLVTAQDLNPWLATPPPHPENQYRLSAPPAGVLYAARADFGGMLITRDCADELDPL